MPSDAGRYGSTGGSGGAPAGPPVGGSDGLLITHGAFLPEIRHAETKGALVHAETLEAFVESLETNDALTHTDTAELIHTETNDALTEVAGDLEITGYGDTNDVLIHNAGDLEITFVETLAPQTHTDRLEIVEAVGEFLGAKTQGVQRVEIIRWSAFGSDNDGGATIPDNIIGPTDNIRTVTTVRTAIGAPNPTITSANPPNPPTNAYGSNFTFVSAQIVMWFNIPTRLTQLDTLSVDLTVLDGNGNSLFAGNVYTLSGTSDSSGTSGRTLYTQSAGNGNPPATPSDPTTWAADFIFQASYQRTGLTSETQFQIDAVALINTVTYPS